MGYRAHVVTQHRKYGSEIFSDVFQFEGYIGFLQENVEGFDELYESEQQDYYEVPVEGIENEIKRLKTLKQEEQNEHYEGYTNAEVISAWEHGLKEKPAEDDYITLEWF